MSMLRNVLTYMGLGPDEDYDDGYLYERDRSSTIGDLLAEPADDLVIGSEVDPDPQPDPHSLRSRPDWLPSPAQHQVEGPRAETSAPVAGPDAGPADDGPAAPGGEQGFVLDEGRSTRERPSSSVRAELRSRPVVERPLRAVPPADLGQTDLVQPENGITVRAVPAEAEAEMASQTDTAYGGLERRQVTSRTVSPRSFGEAKVLADEFKADIPVVMSLRGTDRELARRLIDFASGICYALDGSMEKLAPQVFLLTPPGVEVSAEERRRLEQRGYDR
jgi:cell division inhibitor SepF